MPAAHIRKADVLMQRIMGKGTVGRCFSSLQSCASLTRHRVVVLSRWHHLWLMRGVWSQLRGCMHRTFTTCMFCVSVVPMAGSVADCL